EGARPRSQDRQVYQKAGLVGIKSTAYSRNKAAGSPWAARRLCFSSPPAYYFAGLPSTVSEAAFTTLDRLSLHPLTDFTQVSRNCIPDEINRWRAHLGPYFPSLSRKKLSK